MVKYNEIFKAKLGKRVLICPLKSSCEPNISSRRLFNRTRLTGTLFFTGKG